MSAFHTEERCIIGHSQSSLTVAYMHIPYSVPIVHGYIRRKDHAAVVI